MSQRLGTRTLINKSPLAYRLARSLYRICQTAYARAILQPVAWRGRPDLSRGLAAAQVEAFRYSGPDWPVAWEQREALVQTIQARHPHHQVERLAEAERVMRRQLPLLGLGRVRLGEEIDWHADPATGYLWDRRAHWRLIEPGKAPGVDIKFVWELSRFRHLPVLGQAYWLSGDEQYPREFVAQVDSWLAANPYRLGPNWASPLEAAIRACNWLLAWRLLRTAPSLDDDFAARLLGALLQHGRHLRAHLEWGGLHGPQNHLLGNLVGLLYLGALVPGAPPEWSRFAVLELERQMRRQVYSDGVNFEASVPYHRFAFELCLLGAIVLRAAGRGFTAEYDERLRAMALFLRAAQRPDGRLPQFGDNDSGVVHALSESDNLDPAPLLALAAAFLERPELCEEQARPDALWLAPGAVGGWRLEVGGASTLQPAASNLQPPTSFPGAGLYVIRYGDDYALVSCGPNGQGGNGGHAHNDKLSVELFMDGQPVLIDPGTASYTGDPASRNLLRSTRAHSTVEVDGQEQSRLDPSLLFRLPDTAQAACLEWSVGVEAVRFVGEHYGYQRLPGKVTHRRRLTYHVKPRVWEIEDTVSGQGRHRLDLRFQLAYRQASSVADLEASAWPEYLGTRPPHSALAFQVGRVDTSKLLLVVWAEAPFEASLETGPYSPAYGGLERIPVLRVALDTHLPATIHSRFLRWP